MAQPAALRATSFAVSAGMLGAITLAALTMSITLRGPPEFAAGPVVTIERPPEPPVQRPRDRPLQIPRPAEPAMIPFPVEPTQPTQTLIDPTEITSTPPALMTITRPRWTRRPSGLQAYYPRRALQRGMEGEVLLDCLVGVTGLLNCSVVTESPAGWGFGEAALLIARDHRMVPAARDGIAVEGRYSMRVPFRVE